MAAKVTQHSNEDQHFSLSEAARDPNTVSHERPQFLDGIEVRCLSSDRLHNGSAIANNLLNHKGQALGCTSRMRMNTQESKVEGIRDSLASDDYGFGPSASAIYELGYTTKTKPFLGDYRQKPTIAARTRKGTHRKKASRSTNIRDMSKYEVRYCGGAVHKAKQPIYKNHENNRAVNAVEAGNRLSYGAACDLCKRCCCSDSDVKSCTYISQNAADKDNKTKLAHNGRSHWETSLAGKGNNSSCSASLDRRHSYLASNVSSDTEDVSSKLTSAFYVNSKTAGENLRTIDTSTGANNAIYNSTVADDVSSVPTTTKDGSNKQTDEKNGINHKMSDSRINSTRQSTSADDDVPAGSPGTQSMSSESTLTVPGLEGMDIRQCGGVNYFLFSLGTDLEPHQRLVRHIEIRDDDVITVGFPRSGNHWTFEVVSMILNQRVQFDNEHFYSRLLEYLGDGINAHLQNIKSPRNLTSHCRLHRMPEGAVTKRVKMIYVMRNPKDMLVSLYNFTTNLSYERSRYCGTWDEFFQLQMRGVFPWGTWFDHVLSTERFLESNPDQPVYILIYEHMKLDPEREIKALCSFLGKPDTKSEVIARTTEFNNMKSILITTKMAEQGSKHFQNGPDAILRKGIIGDWKNWFTVAQNETFNEVFDSKMAGSKLGELIRYYL